MVAAKDFSRSVSKVILVFFDPDWIPSQLLWPQGCNALIASGLGSYLLQDAECGWNGPQREVSLQVQISTAKYKPQMSTALSMCCR
jgi:hypothetical protein